MEDREIVGLFLSKNEDGILAAQEKYGAYCTYIARHILENDDDACECVNDALLSAWNSIPPHTPERLSAYLGKLTRNAALDRLYKKNALKRKGDTDGPLSDGVETSFFPDYAGDLSLKDAVDRFLSSLTVYQRNVFLQRYWYGCSENEIAVLHKTSVGAIKAQLHRTKVKFSKFLHKEGYKL